MGDKYIYCGGLENYNDDLTALSREGELDIMKVSYMGEVLWKRKELYTLGELYNKWENKEIDGYTLIANSDFAADMHHVWEKIGNEYFFGKKIKYTIDRVWEIVEENN